MKGLADVAAFGTAVVLTVFGTAWITLLPTLGLLWLCGALK